MVVATPEGVHYFTPQSIADHSSPFEEIDAVFVSQIEHHFQVAQPVIRVEVQRLNSQLCTKCSLTGIDQPNTSSYFMRVKYVKADNPDILLSDSDSEDHMRHRSNKSKGIATAKVQVDGATLQICWKCRKGRVLQVTSQLHRMGNQGIVCQGRYANKPKAFQLLWQAHNLALDLRGVLCKSRYIDASDRDHYWSQDQKVPEVWVRPQVATGSEMTKLQRLLGFIKFSHLFHELFEASNLDLATWKKTWRPMTDTHALGIETLARDLFGNPLLPYPEMTLTTILVRFSLTYPTTRSILLRFVFGLEPKTEIRDCETCALDFMILDYIDGDAAVKIHIPLRSGLEIRRHDSWESFSKVFSIETCSENRRWNEMGYMFQGWSEQVLLTRRIDLDKHEEFDETGGSKHINEFQPFANDSEWNFWQGDLVSGEARNAELEALDDV